MILKKLVFLDEFKIARLYFMKGASISFGDGSTVFKHGLNSLNVLAESFGAAKLGNYTLAKFHILWGVHNAVIVHFEVRYVNLTDLFCNDFMELILSFNYLILQG